MWSEKPFRNKLKDKKKGLKTLQTARNPPNSVRLHQTMGELQYKVTPKHQISLPDYLFTSKPLQVKTKNWDLIEAWYQNIVSGGLLCFHLYTAMRRTQNREKPQKRGEIGGNNCIINIEEGQKGSQTKRLLESGRDRRRIDSPFFSFGGFPCLATKRWGSPQAILKEKQVQSVPVGGGSGCVGAQETVRMGFLITRVSLRVPAITAARRSSFYAL